VNEPQHTILLVEDDRAVQRALAEALHESGFTVLAEHDGEWARSTFEQRQVDLVVLDAVLPRRNGLQLALDIRRTEKGRRLPIVMFSGVYDAIKVKPQLDEIGSPVRFLEKPVEPSQVVAIVRKALGLQESEVSDPSTKRRRRERARLEAKSKDLAALADLAEMKSVESDSQIRFRGAALVRGNLRETEFAEVLSELHRWRATGALLLENTPVKKLVWVREGAPIFVRSNLLVEALGQLLVRERMITLAECEEGLRRLKESKRQLGTELIEMGCISPANLAYALQLQVEQKLFDVFDWTEGSYRFNPRATMPAMQIALELTPAKTLLEGIRRTYDDPRALRGLGDVEAHAVALTDDPLDRFQDMGLDPEEAQFYALIDGRRTVRELLDFGVLPAEDARKLLYALRCANMIHFAVPDARPAQPAAPIVARPPPLPDLPERAMSEPEREQRDQVQRLAARAQDLRRGTLFDVLGVRSDASELEIRYGFAALAKENHPDRLGPDATSEARAFAEDVFMQISFAHDTLVDRRKRAEYELQLRSGVQRSDGDEVARILKAEQRFRQGEALLAGNDAPAAMQAFAEAARLYPEEAEFHACLGWATWLSLAPGEGAAAQARPLLDRALQLNPRIDRAYVFRGRIARALGKAREAEAEFEKALLCNPGCIEALHELRLSSHGQTSGARPDPGKPGSIPHA
jgi:DNA-binding response OmpR family regulator/tetratricopeptide (TPR) repeat protein